MADIVNLQFNADTSQLDQAKDKLGQVADATQRASGSASQFNVTLDATQQAQQRATAAAINNAQGLSAVSEGADKAAAASEKFLQKLQDQQDRLQMTHKAYLELQADMNGVRDQAQPMIDAIDKASESHGKFSIATSGARRELIVLGHEMLNGNWTRFSGSMMVMAERTDAMSLLMSPLGLAIGGVAAVIGVFAMAAVKGAAETTAMNNALIMTNDYAGQTVSSLRQLAVAASETGSNIGTAKEAYVTLASTGKFTGDTLVKVGQAIISTHEATGAAVKNLVKDYEDIAKSPVDASVKLNEQYHYLTLSVLEQIETLKKQGKEVEAVNLAEDTYASAMKTRTKQIEENQGTILRGWTYIKNEASKAWDAMLGIGRQQTVAEQIKVLEDEKASSSKMGNTTAVFSEDTTMSGNGGTFGADKEARLRELKHLAAMDDARAASQSATDQANDNAIAKHLQDEKHHTRTRQAPNTSNAESQAAIQAIKDQIAELASTEKEAEEKAKTDMENGILSRKQYYDKIYSLRNELLENEKPLIQKEIDASQGLKSLAARQKYADELSKIDKQIALNKAKNAADDAKVDADEEKSINKTIEALGKKAQALQATQQKQIDTSSMSKTQKTFYDNNLKVNSISNDAESAIIDTAKKNNPQLSVKDLLNLDDVKKGFTQVEQMRRQLLNGNIQANAEMEAHDNDWLGGLITGMSGVQSKSATMFDSMKSYGQSVTQSLTNAFVTFTQTGKISFRSLITDMIVQLERLMAEKAFMSIIGMMIPGGGAATSLMGIGSSIAGGVGGSAGGIASSMGVGSSGASLFTMPAAKGAALQSGVQMFAAGGVVNSPTSFNHSGGLGVMGEAGPEAIMPLKRSSDGSLGVTVSGAAGTKSSNAGGDTYNVVVNVQGGDNAQQTGDIVSAAVLKQMQAISRNEIAKANRPGGQNNSLVLGNSK